MAVTVYGRLRLFWGALDTSIAYAQTPAYTPAQFVSGGPSASAGSGIGVRKAVLVIDRSALGVGIDTATCHFSFLNMTSGSPDDTWITSDYTALETALKAWMTNVSNYMGSNHKFSEIRWYRTGSGVVAPNPPERVTPVSPLIAGLVTTNYNPVQSACSITYRTGSRRHWGRTYLPWSKPTAITGRPLTADVDNVASSTSSLIASAATSDMHAVVVCPSLGSSLNIESVSVDDVLDVIRRRRLNTTTYHKILP